MRSTCKHRQTNENTNKRRQRQRESGKRESDALSPCSPLQSQQVWQTAVRCGCHVDARRACCLSLTLTSCALSVWMPRLVYCCEQLICAARKPTAAAGVASRLTSPALPALPASPCQPTAGQPFGFSWFFIAAPHARVSASLGFAQLADRIWSSVFLCFSVRFLNK